MSRLRQFLLWTASLVSGAAACAQTVDTVPPPAPNLLTGAGARREVVVGAYAHNYPYSFREKPDGPLTGFAVELLDRLAAAMNLKLRRVELPNAEVQVRFRSGDFDMLQMLSESKGREAWADFSVPLLYVQNVAFVRRDDRSVRTFADLRGRRFAVTGMGSASELFLRAWEKDPKLSNVSSAEDALRLVAEGGADAVLLSRLTALSLIEKHRLGNIVELPDPAAHLEIRHCFAVHKGDTALLARLNEGLSLLRCNGEYDEIHRKWFGRYEPLHFTREEVTRHVAATLLLALAATAWGLWRQHSLRRRIAGQARELAEKEGVLRALYDNVPTGMCVFAMEPAGPRLLDVNRRAESLLEMSGGDARGRLLADLPLAPDWRARLAGLLGPGSGAPGLAAREQVLPKGQRHIVFTLVPLAPADGLSPHLCLLLDDVTERRRLDEEISQSRRLRAVGELVGGIAHEFNNLMTPVLLKAGEIEALQIDNPVLREDLEVIGTATRRAAELTRRLLTFGRKGTNQMEVVQLHSIVSGALNLVRPAIDRRIVWENVVPADLQPLFFNATDLNQIVVNLLLNGRDTLLEKLESSPGGEWTPCIRVSAVQIPAETGAGRATPGGEDPLAWQRLSIADNGRGMAPEVRERIFEPFFTTKEVGRGTGLGLATVWHLVTGAGGRVEVETTPGSGTCFNVYLPVRPVPPSALRAEATSVEVANGGVRILVVDDDELFSRTITSALRRDGHHVRCIADGGEAWEHLRGPHPGYELLVVDINLPGIDGRELVRRVRQAGFGGRIMVVSGCVVADEPPFLPDAGVDRVLPKPFGIQEFRTAVRRCLDGRGP